MNYEPFDPVTAPPDGRVPRKLSLFDAQGDGPWRGHIAGEALGTSITVLAYGNDTEGEGPLMHIHPYDEVFVVLEGHARFHVGDQIFDATAGDVLLGPAGLPHRFENVGPGRLQTIDIHVSPQWRQNKIEL